MCPTSKKKVATALVLVIIIISLQCATYKDDNSESFNYPEPQPDSVPLVLLPGIVSGDGRDFNAAFSPDGKSFYFTRTVDDHTKIFVTHYEERRWTQPTRVLFSDSDFDEADPAFSPDGTFFFISNRPKDTSDTLKDYDIWFVSPDAGQWSKPQNLAAVNSDSSEYYISFSSSENLYFASSREGGFGLEDIYVSRLSDSGNYTLPKNLGPSINTSKSEYDPFILQDESLIIFTSSNRTDSFGGADLYLSQYKKNKWGQGINLGSVINTNSRDFCPYFSPDMKYFFYSSENQVKWVSADAVMGTSNKL